MVIHIVAITRIWLDLLFAKWIQMKVLVMTVFKGGIIMRQEAHVYHLIGEAVRAIGKWTKNNIEFDKWNKNVCIIN